MATPMFPLGTVLLPGSPLPLSVFEPRYRRMVLDCLDADGTFGTVLIERGSEVGGGDQRFAVGTLARIVDAAPASDGTWRVMAVGMHRLRIAQWLPDDPYPRADAAEWPDESAVADGALPSLLALVRRTLAQCAELGLGAAPATVELPPDPTEALWAACAVAPLGALDRHRLLGCPGARERAVMLGELLVDVQAVLSRRLSGG